jgi:hypothetical protein
LQKKKAFPLVVGGGGKKRLLLPRRAKDRACEEKKTALNRFWLLLCEQAARAG